MEDFRGKWKMGNIHKPKVNKTPIIGMFYLGIDLKTSKKELGILRSFDEENKSAVIEDSEGTEYVVRLNSLKFYQL